MKNFLPILILISVISCKKSAEADVSKVDSAKIIDSINLARTKINDSILASRSFKNLEGTHSLTHDMLKGTGKITLKKIGQDEYQISGKQSDGKQYLTIDGTARMTSSKNLKFEGDIKQSISDNDNGKMDVRSGKRNFSTTDGGKTFKLHESLNSSGFADKIIIKF
ncbi:hypothetical protein LUD75_09200 [Epilithonimonas sp. JDS]|uniref:hypothetical protein n=1 Tax=Epilithonimonas sp. JDS TaxID=2902797 RepID=UPI001E35EC8A|nr:hypothetical protein [Epilithonimonas sp. JDS]MCD9854880.1 hypothetical protein [Epilithonimonas sp. JDS]